MTVLDKVVLAWAKAPHHIISDPILDFHHCKVEQVAIIKFDDHLKNKITETNSNYVFNFFIPLEMNSNLADNRRNEKTQRMH